MAESKIKKYIDNTNDLAKKMFVQNTANSKGDFFSLAATTILNSLNNKDCGIAQLLWTGHAYYLAYYTRVDATTLIMEVVGAETDNKIYNVNLKAGSYCHIYQFTGTLLS